MSSIHRVDSVILIVSRFNCRLNCDGSFIKVVATRQYRCQSVVKRPTERSSRNREITINSEAEEQSEVGQQKMLRKLCSGSILVSSAALIISYVTCGEVIRPTEVKPTEYVATYLIHLS